MTGVLYYSQTLDLLSFALVFCCLIFILFLESRPHNNVLTGRDDNRMTTTERSKFDMYQRYFATSQGPNKCKQSWEKKKLNLKLQRRWSNLPLRLPEEKPRHPALMDRLDPRQGAAINKQMHICSITRKYKTSASRKRQVKLEGGHTNCSPTPLAMHVLWYRSYYELTETGKNSDNWYFPQNNSQCGFVSNWHVRSLPMKAQRRQSSGHLEPGSHQHYPVQQRLLQLPLALTSVELHFKNASKGQWVQDTVIMNPKKKIMSK